MSQEEMLAFLFGEYRVIRVILLLGYRANTSHDVLTSGSGGMEADSPATRNFQKTKSRSVRKPRLGVRVNKIPAPRCPEVITAIMKYVLRS